MAEGPSDDGTTAEWGTGATFGHYRLIRLLGSGGFGEVYEAFDTRKSRTVALKLLPPSYSGNPIFRKRLFREASTAGRLNEPHVVPIHDYGEIDGQLYIDMRLVRGSDLRGVLDESGPMEPARAVRIVDQIASALDAAHAEQIIHRDVKPANILLTGHDFACLVDFGLANAATDAKLTTAGNTVGTFAYMSPERLADEEIDLRTDVYALTCVLYECLTGTPPFPHADLAALIAAHLTAPIPSPSRQRPGIAHQFDEVVTCGMAKDREDRYASAGALAAAAAQALAAEHPDTVSAPSGPANPLPPVDAMRRRRRRIAALVGALALVLAVAGAVIPRLQHRPATPAKAAAANAGTTPIARIAATIGVGARPEAVAVDPANHTVYTANYGDSTMSIIDAASHTLTATVPVGKGPVWVAVDPGTHLACTANNRDDTVSLIDTGSRAVTATVKVGTNPWGIAVDPTSHVAYVANMWDYSVSAIDLATHRVVATIPVGKNPYGIAIDPSTATAYVANSSDGTLSAIDTVSHTVTATIPVGNDPRGVGLDLAAHRAYVTQEAEGAVSVINLDNRSVAGTIHVGNSPYGVTVDPTVHTVYTANHNDSVSVIDTSDLAVAGVIRIGKDTFALAVDPDTHILYTANHDATVSVIVPARERH
ncbi:MULTISPECIES: serine/threonine-protein kinase [Mycobacterium]|uniref:non-specific serine/threonine protein kinase n=3 Tax=Mycobacterium kiyosense TaxID=2871094 RepID=A0A9P3QB02_9MYCO|nr:MULTISPECIES: serine/threonine-protein kinase [Mycobacterium]BDE11895.1 hypothetical protein MKCMC460_07550 [Mycobacterium sp. 20KCMC460]GLB91886.1 hypothetical protein SRL2020130_47030 [Mycobacterium kiyosense]GLC03949.1 hypothetical protein SRL2020400_45400 [Mycobacterium kiyosense]GLC08827.1 hypothetical protein SRL2020411_34730 [Mycobacterium kiyosense]GLC14926.1 hypothetical protein SRL2020448_35290 [Mycobacterium kiyosense]